MEGVEAIINTIMTQANNTVSNIMNDAEADRKKLLEDTHEELNHRQEKSLSEATVSVGQIIQRRLTLAELDSRKLILKAKQKIIDDVYYETITKLLNMTDNIYREFIGNFIDFYAEDNDIVIVSERDSKRLNSEWLKKLAVEKGINLTMSNSYHNFRGGIILSSKKYDKNLTLETLVKEIRNETVSIVAKKLFGKEVFES